MKELTEIRIGESIVGLKDNLVKTAILPKTSAELDRDLNIQGNVVVEGAVYAHNELHVKNDARIRLFLERQSLPRAAL